MIEVVCFTGTSGLTDYAVSLARALGNRSRLVTSSLLPSRFRQLGIEVVTPFRRSRQYPVDMLRFGHGVLQRRPEWMLWQGPLKLPLVDGLVARYLRWRGVRCAVTVHDVLPHYPRPWSRATFGFYYRSFERVIVHSQAALKGVRDLGVHAPAMVVPHGVYDLFCLTNVAGSQARLQVPGLLPGRVVVLFFGHLETRKGLFEFLEAARLLRGDPRFQFLISGASSLSVADSARLQEHATLAGNVVLHTRRIPFEEVELHFGGSDIVALPYLEGTTSGVLKMAIAFGKPVVASAVGDLPEEIPVNAGLCVPLGPDFSARFAAALTQVADEIGRWREGMAVVGARLQWPVIAGQIEAFLNEDRRA